VPGCPHGVTWVEWGASEGGGRSVVFDALGGVGEPRGIGRELAVVVVRPGNSWSDPTMVGILTDGWQWRTVSTFSLVTEWSRPMLEEEAPAVQLPKELNAWWLDDSSVG
jgi:hypothetical protein